MPDALVMNATSTGLTNLAMQAPSVATIGGGGLLVLVLLGASIWMAHEFNRRNSWLRKICDWMGEFAIGRAMVGGFTVLVGGALFLLAQFFSSSDGQGMFRDIAIGVVALVCAFLGLVLIGVVFTPIYAYALRYCFPDEPPEPRRVRRAT
jgi:hypothetical protein